MLSHRNDETVNIMTLEDPVEYPVTMMRQTSVNEMVKMDFANGIRSMMRQDPDIILVGEVRDRETADMAFRAAMTGHQVFTTLHTNSALGAFPRLLDIGILPDIMAGNIIGVIAQRLVRLLCPHCKEAYTPTNTNPPSSASTRPPRRRSTVPWVARRCSHKGYRGRLALIELLRMDPILDELVANHAPLHEIRRAAFEHGYHPLAEDGIQRVKDGVTSLSEVARVVDLTGRV